MSAEFNGKRIELLQQLIPGIKHVAVLANPEHPGEDTERDFVARRAQALSLRMEYYPTRQTAELDGAFKRLAADPPQAINLFADGFAVQNRAAIIDFAAKLQIPVISGWAIFAQSGPVCTYGPRLNECYRRLGYFVDRLLKGAKPADLPIERPTLTETIFNLRAAKALGLTIAPTLLAQADEIIE